MQIRLIATAIGALLLANCSGPPATRAPLAMSHHRAPAEARSHAASLAHRTTGTGARTNDGSVGLASYYGASGLTAAHRSLPLGTRVRVTNTSNGRSVVVRISDRGPFVRGRSIDLSHSAAKAVGMTEAGLAKVRMEVLQ